VKTSDPAALTRQLTTMREQLQKAGTPAQKVQVVIAPSRQTKYNDLIRVYESALDAGFSRVAFATAQD
jgi:biopolymer transport protein ExbD